MSQSPQPVVHHVRHFVHHRIIRTFEEFFAQEASAGVFLVVATAAALLWANFSSGGAYEHFWTDHISILTVNAGFSWQLVVNDGLMAVFFFVVGLEIKRELLAGELADRRRAALPVIAAAGGAVLPAIVYAACNLGRAGQRGWGIPMATDIAFAVGVLAILGNRVPIGIKVFLTALAIADDLMAVLVIALFYTAHIRIVPLLMAVGLLAGLTLLNRAGVCRAWPYIVSGLALWFVTLISGIHSTIAGVALAACIPAHGDRPLLRRLEHRLHPVVTFGIMPLFALANAGLSFKQDHLSVLLQPVVIGTALGLLLGKPLGITLAAVLAVQMRVAALPSRVSWLDLHAASWLGGIGFTMSLFIGDLAFRHAPTLLEEAKLGIFTGSLAAGILGSALLLLRASTVAQRL